MKNNIDTDIERSAEAIHNADALMVGTGAGMSVDSGLPDFRGDKGFWRAYPPIEKLGLNFEQIATPHWFKDDPTFAWGFFAHRLNLYRKTVPHEGYEMLQQWIKKFKNDCAFVLTSNVDGQHQKSGTSSQNIWECAGSINYLQCNTPCSDEIWSADGLDLSVDMNTIRLKSPIPQCPHCNGITRPNIHMFKETNFVYWKHAEQGERCANWIRNNGTQKIVVLEGGAGERTSMIRPFCEELSVPEENTLIRINPRTPKVPNEEKNIGLPLTALEAIQRINTVLEKV